MAHQTASKQVSEWNAGNLEMIRIDEILQIIDAQSMRLNMRQTEALEPYYAALKSLWHNIRAYMDSDTLKKNMDAALDDVYKDIIGFYSSPNWQDAGFPMKTKIKLDNIHNDLMQFRHDVGLGIRTHRMKSETEKLKEALHIGER